MFGNNNILPLVFTFLPALLYSLLLYVFTPKQCGIRWKTGSLFFVMGLVSTIAVNAFNYTFPEWNVQHKELPLYTAILIYAMKVGFIEETAKFFMFKTTEWYRSKHAILHPSAIMFYAMSVSCGFAVSENILYAQIYGGDVLVIRSISSVLVHMTCGLFMGYAVAWGRRDFAHRRDQWRNIKFAIFAVFLSSTFHGIYDYSIMSKGDMANSLVLVIAGILCAVFMYRSYFRASIDN